MTPVVLLIGLSNTHAQIGVKGVFAIRFLLERGIGNRIRDVERVVNAGVSEERSDDPLLIYVESADLAAE